MALSSMSFRSPAPSDEFDEDEEDDEDELLRQCKDTQGPIQDNYGKYTTNIVYNEVLF